MVPLAAELVVGDDDHRVPRARGALDGADQVDEVVAAAADARIAGVLVLESDRLDEAHRVELAVPVRARDEVLELDLVAEVRAPGRAWREARVVVQRLVV